MLINLNKTDLMIVDAILEKTVFDKDGFLDVYVRPADKYGNYIHDAQNLIFMIHLCGGQSDESVTNKFTSEYVERAINIGSKTYDHVKLKNNSLDLEKTYLSIIPTYINGGTVGSNEVYALLSNTTNTMDLDKDKSIIIEGNKIEIDYSNYFSEKFFNFKAVTKSGAAIPLYSFPDKVSFKIDGVEASKNEYIDICLYDVQFQNGEALNRIRVRAKEKLIDSNEKNMQFLISGNFWGTEFSDLMTLKIILRA